MPFATLKDICRAQGTPHHELCHDAAPHLVARRRVTDTQVWKLGSPNVYCGAVRDAVVFANSMLYMRDGSYVFHGQTPQSLPNFGGFTDYSDLFIESQKANLFTHFVEEECVYFGGMWAQPNQDVRWGQTEDPNHANMIEAKNFGHFVFEFLVRMAVFNMLGLSERLPLVVCEELPQRWIDFVVLAGGSRERMIRVSAFKPNAFRKVWVSSACGHRDQQNRYRIWSAGIHWLRFKMYQSIGGPKLGARRRIYLGRDVGRRRAVNEPDVIALLHRYGIEPVAMMELSAREQLELVSGAEIIVASLGAGTLMSYFAPTHCINIILATKDVGTSIWGGSGAACILQQPYQRVECEAIPREDMQRLNVVGADELADYRVDLVELQNVVEAAVKNIETRQKRDMLQI